MEDFYLDENGLASYFEAQWLDIYRKSGGTKKLKSNSKLVSDFYIDSTFFREISKLISSSCNEINLNPKNMIEVGPSLGRTCYELIKQNPTLTDITIIEPSQRLLSNFKKILINGGEQQFPYIKGLKEIDWLTLNTETISSKCSHIQFTCLNDTFDINTIHDQYDLTLCLNVLDQCESPLAIVNGLLERTNSGGILVLSCSYQWNKKHLKNMNEGISDINNYFPKTWVKIAESELEYKFRFNERFSRLFLSHIVIYKKLPDYP